MPSPRKKETRSSSLGLVVFAGVLTCVFMLGAMWSMARRADAAALARDTALAHNGLNLVIREIQESVNRVAMWDDAVANLDNRYDKAWAEASIGRYFSDRFERSFVIDSADHPIFASRDGELRSFQSYSALASIIIEIVRRREVERGPFHNVRPGLAIVSRPITQSIIGVIDGRLVILTASLVQPDSGRVLPRKLRSPIVVVAELIDGRFLSQFSEQFLLEDVAATIGAGVPERGRGDVQIQDASGRKVATLHWQPARPGSRMLGNLAAPLTSVMLLLAIVVTVLLRRSAQFERELIASETQAKHMALHDGLTGLPNRVLFTDRLREALDQLRDNGSVSAVHLIDLDRFKEVNDTLGHNAGDELICEVAKRLLPACAPGDTLARLGGDEFALVQSAPDVESALDMADKILRLLADPMELSAGHVLIGASVGVTLIDSPQIDPTEAIRQADMALYASKADGRGRATFFRVEMDATLRERRQTEVDLREAMANGALHMVYQPLVDENLRIFGFESLLRWRHPARGDVAPGYFVAVAEECGLIEEIGLFALRRTFEDSRRFPRHKFAINVSAHQLRTGNLPARIAALAMEVGVRPDRFELEITERVLLGDDPQTLEQLRQFKALGFTITLDDFGTGYSSLSYLRRYPVDKIKIDRSFVRNLGQDEQADAVVRAIVNMAQALRIRVLAEGVETRQQYAALRALGCAEVQGYLFGKPVSAEDTLRLLTRIGRSRAA